MEKTPDTFVDLGRGTPAWFTFAARILPVGILGQLLSAGLALFRDSSLWGLHAALGGALSFPAVSLVAGALFVSRLRGFGWWAGLTFLLYLLQVILAAGGMPLLLSFHPVNGAFLLAASLVLLANVERRRSQSLAEDNATAKPGKQAALLAAKKSLVAETLVEDAACVANYTRTGPTSPRAGNAGLRAAPRTSADKY